MRLKTLTKSFRHRALFAKLRSFIRAVWYYTYDDVGNPQSCSYPNAATTSYAYNNLNRLTTLMVSNPQIDLESYADTLAQMFEKAALPD